MLAAAPAPPHHGEDKARLAQDRVAAYLADHDVVTPAELRGLDANPQKPLMAIALDGAAAALVRARAIAALRVVATPEVHRFLDKLIDDKAESTDATDRLLLRRAAITRGWLGGPGVEARLAKLFANADPELRVDAAIGIGLTRGGEAANLLRRQLAVETVPRVREQIERQLRSLGHGSEAPKTPPPPKERTPMRGGF